MFHDFTSFSVAAVIGGIIGYWLFRPRKTAKLTPKQPPTAGMLVEANHGGKPPALSAHAEPDISSRYHPLTYEED